MLNIIIYHTAYYVLNKFSVKFALLLKQFIMEKKRLKIYYELTVIYCHPKRRYLKSNYRVRPFDLPGRIKQLERMIDDGTVVSFFVETVFDY